jgi:flagellar FliL protein
MAKAPAKPPVEEPEEDAEGADKEAKPKLTPEKKKLIILIAVGVVLLLLSVGGTFAVIKMMKGHKSDAPKDEAAASESADAEKGKEDAAKEAESAAKEPVVYFPMEPAFLTNFVVNGRPRYLQLSITLMTHDKATIEAVQKHMPLIRNRLVMLLSGEQFDMLRVRAGREALQLKLTDAVKEVLQKETGKANIEKLLFTNFVMQ